MLLLCSSQFLAACAQQSRVVSQDRQPTGDGQDQGDGLNNSSGGCMCKFVTAHWQENNASHSPTTYWYIVLFISIKISLMQTKN